MKISISLLSVAVAVIFTQITLLAQTADLTAQATTPVAKPQWAWWPERHAAKKAEAASKPVDYVFIGDSITHGWEILYGGPGYGLSLSDEAKQYYKEGAGQVVFNERYADRNVLNLGFGGDETQNLLWRLDDGAVDGLNPKAVVLMIGINNIGVSGMSAAETFAGIKAVVAKLREKLPNARIVLMAVLPIHENKPDTEKWQAVVEQLNPTLEKFAAEEKIDFLDIGPKLVGPDGLPRIDLMPDGVHPNADGYRIWADALEPYLK